jgi:hypothetical protein
VLRYIGSVLLCGALCAAGIIHATTEWSVHPSLEVAALSGLAPDHTAEAAAIAESIPELQIVGDDQDNSRRNVRLWQATLAVLGEHRKNYPQEVGDCTAFGAKNAVETMQCVQIQQGSDAKFRHVYPPYFYGIARKQIGGGRLRGDGAVGAWVAKAANEFGVLASDEMSCPPYSGAVAKQWGASGPPAWAITAGKQRLVQAVAHVTTAAQARDAICNGYPVTIASDFGTKTIRPIDGRQVARWDASWAHQMCLTAYDGSGSVPRFYCENSWGAPAHPKPLQGEPPGGFWIDVTDVDRICRQGDCWAFSSFAGFPAQQLDFSVFAANPPSETHIALSDQHYGEAMATCGGVGALGLFVLLTQTVAALRLWMSWATVATCVFVGSVWAAEPTVEAWTEEVSLQAFSGTEVTLAAFDEPPKTKVYVYSPKWCVSCKLMHKDIGNGDETLAVEWIEDETKFPAFVQTQAGKHGYPVIHYPVVKTWRVISGRRTLPQLKTLLEPAKP